MALLVDICQDGFEASMLLWGKRPKHGGRTRLWEFMSSSASFVCEGGNTLVIPEAADEDEDDDDWKSGGDRRSGVVEEVRRQRRRFRNR
ncbi:hypothetical protein ACHAW5_003848 [Stephanodiscus triporus]|uniref:Uncharacterized protein n=1 Tax=Stephanodiscus triporus TaxID=2934178 RepID=A0ABD3NK07_9STRA